MKVYQIYFDAISKSKLLPGMIPYDNSTAPLKYYESWVIYDIWKNKRSEWIKEDYISILSWRFEEKTNLNLSLIKQAVKNDKKKKDVYLFAPPAFWNNPGHTLCKFGHGSIINIAKIADKEKLFPFKLFDYDIEGRKCFCNYFLIKPKLFDKYCNEYLEPFIKYLDAAKGFELKQALSKKHYYRGKDYPLYPFVLEGLFPMFVHRENLSYAHVFEESLKNKYGIKC